MYITVKKQRADYRIPNSSGLVKRLFEMEVPEIARGGINKNISREAGSRTKISVAALEEEIDPVIPLDTEAPR